MNRREADPGIWYDIDDQRLYGSEYLPVAIGPFTFENAYSTRWYASDYPLNPIWFATDATARKVAELVNAFFGPGMSNALKATVESTSKSSFFGTGRNVPERSIRISKYSFNSSLPGVGTGDWVLGSELFSAGRLARDIMMNGLGYAMFSLHAELVQANLLPSNGAATFIDPAILLMYKKMAEKYTIA